MTFFQFFSRLFTKQSEAIQLLAVHQVGKALPTPVNYEAASKQGYQRTVAVFRCVNLLSRCTAGIEWTLFKKGRGARSNRTEIFEHKILDLLDRPNPMQGGFQFMESVIGFRSIAGNSYIEAVGPGNAPPKELWPLRPDRMKIVPGRLGFPQSYEYHFKQSKKVFPVDFVKGESTILHIRTFNPTDDWYGLSPLEAAFLDIDQNTQSKNYNLALLKNSATPSGVLQVRIDESNPRGTLTQEQFDRLKETFDDEYTGVLNGGKPLLLEGGLEWKSIGLAPQQLDMMESRNATARDIAQAFDVPPLLLGLPGDNTFANYKEARLAFYEDNVLPLMNMVRDELNNWLVPAFGEGLILDYDKDNIEALAPKRESKFESLKGAAFLTENEKREAAGYGQSQGLDIFVYPSTVQLIDPNDPDRFKPESTPDNAENVDDQTDVQPVDEEEEKQMLDRQIQHVKIFNLLNDDERRRSWVKQNRARSQLRISFEEDIVEDFVTIFEAVRGVKDVGAEAIEFAVERVIDEAHKKMTGTIKKHVKRAMKQFGRLAFADAKSQRLESIEHKTAFSRFLDFVQFYVERRSGEAIKHIEQTSQKRVRGVIKQLVADTIEEGEGNRALAQRIEEAFADDQAIKVGEARARVIARTEVQMASSNGIREAVKTLQVPGLLKEWISIQDSRTRDEPEHADHLRMNGVKVPLDEKFTVPPDADMDGPGDQSAPPEQVINCRCVQVFKQAGN